VKTGFEKVEKVNPLFTEIGCGQFVVSGNRFGFDEERSVKEGCSREKKTKKKLKENAKKAKARQTSEVSGNLCVKGVGMRR